MSLEGGCYCGAIRYRSDGDPALRLQCHCRECQYLAGGGPNLTMGVPESDFIYTKGTPAQFRRPDLDNPVTREFCGTCGTHLLSRAPGVPGIALLKVGTLDDPAAFGGPQAIIYTVDSQPFHLMPDGVPSFERVPGG